MTTQVFFRQSLQETCDRWTPGVATWNPNTAFYATGTGHDNLSLRLSRGGGMVGVSAATVASSTARHRMLTGGRPLMWVSPPIDRDVTISSAIVVNLWINESSMSANTRGGCYMTVIRADGTVVTPPISAGLAPNAELPTSMAALNWTENAPNSTDVHRGDRLLIVPHFVNYGTMGGGYTVSFDLDGASAGADGDSYVTFTEDFGFMQDAPGSLTSVDGTSNDSLGNSATIATQLAQSFRVPAAMTLSSISIRALKTGSPADNLQVAVQAQSGSWPSGTDLTSGSVAGTTLTTSAADYPIDVADITLSPDTTYWLVLRRSGSTDASNYYRIASMASSGEKAGGWLGSPASYDSGAWVGTAVQHSGIDLTFTSGSTLYPTDTAGGVDPNGATYDSKEAWTSRGAGVATAVVNTAAAPASALQFTTTAGGNYIEWFSKQLQAFTLAGPVLVNIRGVENNGAANATVGCEIAVTASDGTSPTVWGFALWGGEVTTAEAAYALFVAGDDIAVTDGQRLRLRFFTDDASIAAMAASYTVSLYYAGTSGGASGDTYLTFGQSITEYVAGPQPGLINNGNSIFAPTIKFQVYPGIITDTAVIYTPGTGIPVYPPRIDQGTSFYGFTLQLSVTPGIITNSAVIYAPSEAEQVFAGFINNGNQIYTPTAYNPSGVYAPFIDDTALIYDPKAVWVASPPLIDNSAVIYAPNESFQTFPGIITQTVTLYDPTVAAAGVGMFRLLLALLESGATPPASTTVYPGLIDDTALIYAPTTSFIVYSPIITNTGVVYAPSETQQLFPGVITDTAVIYAPTAATTQVYAPVIANGNQIFTPTSFTSQVYAPLITDTLAIYAPNETQQIFPALISSNTQIYAPATTLSVAAGIIANGNQIYAPTAQTTQVYAPFIDDTAILYLPVAGALAAPPLIAQTVQLFTATLASTIYAPVITNAAVVYAPSETTQVFPGITTNAPTMYAPEARTSGVYAPLIPSNTQLYAPTEQLVVFASVITNAAVIYAPNETFQTFPGLINNGNQIFAPTTSFQVNAGIITDTVTLYAPSLALAGSVLPALIDDTAIIYAPVARTTQVYAPVITNTAVIYAPSDTLQVFPSKITDTVTIYAPTQSQVISAGLIANPATLYAPLISLKISAGVITDTTVIYTPTTTSTLAVFPALIDRTMQIYAPRADTSKVYAGLISNLATMYAPSLALAGSAVPPLIPSNTQIYAPTTSFQVAAGTITQTVQVFAPSLSGKIYAPGIDATAQVYTPSTSAQTSAPLISNFSQIYVPAVAVLVQPGRLDATAVLYIPMMQGTILKGIVTIADGQRYKTIVIDHAAHDVTIADMGTGVTVDDN